MIVYLLGARPCHQGLMCTTPFIPDNGSMRSCCHDLCFTVRGMEAHRDAWEQCLFVEHLLGTSAVLNAVLTWIHFYFTYYSPLTDMRRSQI